MIKAILLDLDDTILDFHKAERIALSATLEELGITPTDKVLARYSEINQMHWKRLERGELTRYEVLHGRFRMLFDEMGLDVSEIDAQRIYEWRLGTGHYFLDGAEKLLDDLYGKYDIYLASNGTDIVQTRRIESAGIGKYFKELFISQRIGYDKPSVEYFNRCFERIENFDRASTIIIGDSLTSDILGGINAGIRTCLFNPHGRPGRTDIVPDYEVKDLAEIVPLLEKI